MGKYIHENIDTAHNHSDTVITCNTPPVSQTTLFAYQVHSDNNNDTQYFSPIAANGDNRTQLISESNYLKKLRIFQRLLIRKMLPPDLIVCFILRLSHLIILPQVDLAAK